MKNLLKTLTVLLLLSGSAQLLLAQPVRNNVEKAQDRNQIKMDAATIERDQKEIRNFRQLKRQLGDAVKNGKPGAAANNHAALIQAMQVEIEQGQVKIAAAAKERNQSAREVRSEGREVRRDVRSGRPVAAARDRADKRDDQRDLRDDQQDLNELKARNARQKEILAVFQSIKVKDNPSLEKLKAKKNLLDEFETTMIRDMGENWEELQEDKGELREDRRETREDRRNR